MANKAAEDNNKKNQKKTETKTKNGNRKKHFSFA